MPDLTEPEPAAPAATTARQWLEGTAPPLPAGAHARALARALKDLCYEAWNTEPPRAARAAAALRQLVEAGVPAEQADEVAGLADWTAGIAHATRGEMAEAVTCFDGACARLRAAGLADDAAQTQVPKIMALSMLGQHAQALACAEAALVELESLGNLRAASRVSGNLGTLLLRRDDYANAVRHSRKAAVLFARIGDHENSITADICMAMALSSQGDFDAGLQLFERARKRAEGRSLDMLCAMVDESVALIDLARGRYREALAGLESARRRYESLAVPQALAIAEKQLADAYLELRLLPEARALFDVAVEKFRALDMPEEEAWAQAQRGRALAWLGESGAARASFAAAATIFQAQEHAVGSAHIALAEAELALARGDAAGAIDAAERAGTAYAEAAHADGRARADATRAAALLDAGRADEAGAAFDALLDRARALGQVQIQVRALTGQGLLRRRAGAHADARARFEAAIELFEDQQRALPGDEFRSAFLGDHLRPYLECLRAALDAGDGAQALTELERWRARALGERLEDGAAPAVADDSPALRDRLNLLYRRQQRLQEEAGTSATLDAEIARTEHELLERARRLRLTAATARTGLASGWQPAQLQAALRTGDALVEYGVLDDELFACVVTPDAVHLHRRLAAWSQVRDAVRSMRFQFDSLRHGSAPVQQHLPTLTTRAVARMKQLHALVWAPLAPQLDDASNVFVVPQGDLAAVPFAALHDGDRAVGDRHRIALAPSARVALRGLLRLPNPARRVLALGESTRLAHAAQEARTVAGLFDDAQAYIDGDASLANLRRHAPAADVLHLACHAQFRGDNPRFSALHLHDGALSVDQAEGLGLASSMVVLSACETALADVQVGGEMVGLVRAFLVAGAARVVASLWPVDDAVTVRFMTDFYQGLRQGQTPAAALQAAQISLRREHPHPYFWSAFTLYGGW